MKGFINWVESHGFYFSQSGASDREKGFHTSIDDETKKVWTFSSFHLSFLLFDRSNVTIQLWIKKLKCQSDIFICKRYSRYENTVWWTLDIFCLFVILHCSEITFSNSSVHLICSIYGWTLFWAFEQVFWAFSQFLLIYNCAFEEKTCSKTNWANYFWAIIYMIILILPLFFQFPISGDLWFLKAFIFWVPDEISNFQQLQFWIGFMVVLKILKSNMTLSPEFIDLEFN